MPYNTIREFERQIAVWAGAKYGVAVESGSAALFLCCLYRKVGYTVIPARTYPSVPCAIINAGGYVGFEQRPWAGVYELSPYRIIDGALRFRQGMYEGGLHCLSFHIKKNLPIGRGGMILTDDLEAIRWLKRARFDGRDEVPLPSDDLSMLGFNFYMSPDQAARGLELFNLIKDREIPDLDSTQQGYPDLSQLPVYQSVGLIKLRRASMADARQLLAWKNEADTRANSIVSQDEIKMDDHLVWLEKTLADERVEFFIIQWNGNDAGDLRINCDEDDREVSIRLDKKYRGCGLATRAISMVRGPNLIAKIVATNVASMRSFIANGFRPWKLIKEPVPHYIFRKHDDIVRRLRAQESQ